MLRYVLTLFVWIVCTVPLLATESDPSDFVRVLEEGPCTEWDVAARRLVQYKEKYKRYVLDPRSLGSLLKRWEVFSPDTRALIAKGMQRNTGLRTPETVAIFARLLRDPDARVREETFQILLKHGTVATAPALAGYIPSNDDDRIKLIRHLVQVNDEKHAGKRARLTLRTLTEASTGVRDELFSLLFPFFADPSPQVHLFLVEKVERFIDERLNGTLFNMRLDPDAGLQALLTLATRGDVRACGPLLEWAGQRDNLDERAKRFSQVGEACGLLQPAYFLNLYRKATSLLDRRDRMQLLLGIPVKPFDRLVSVELHQTLNEAAVDTDPELRQWASERLATIARYESDQALQGKKADQAVMRWRYGLAAALIAAGALGIFIRPEFGLTVLSCLELSQIPFACPFYIYDKQNLNNLFYLPCFSSLRLRFNAD